MNKGYYFHEPLIQISNSSGSPYAGALVNFYIAGTSTRATIYKDHDLSVPHTNPVEAMSNGRFPAIFIDPEVEYKVDITDADGVSVPGYPVDNYSNSPEYDADSIGNKLNPQHEAEDAAGIQPWNVLNTMGDVMFPRYEAFDVRRYGSQADAVDAGGWSGTDNQLAFAAAAKAARILAGGEMTVDSKTGNKLYAPPGDYYMGSDVDFRECDGDFRGSIKTGTSGAKVILGGDGTRPNCDFYMFSVLSDEGMTSAKLIDDIDIEVRGLQGQTIHINHTGTLKLWADRDVEYTRTNSYSYIHAPYLRNFDMEGAPRPADEITGGWQTELHLYLGDLDHFRCGRADYDTYQPNCIYIYGGTLENENSTITFNAGYSIDWKNLRLESFDFSNLYFGPRTRDIVIERSYHSSPSSRHGVAAPEDYDDFGIGNLLLNSDERAYQMHPVIDFDVDTLQMDDDTTPTKYNLLGVGTMDDDDVLADASPAAGNITRAGGALSVGAFKTFLRSHLIPVSPNGHTSIEFQLRGVGTVGQGCRMALLGYDEDRNLIENDTIIDITGSNYEWIESAATAGEYYCKIAGGANPRLHRDDGAISGSGPSRVELDGAFATKGSRGSLANDEWDWDDEDPGYYTVYVKLAGGDPDSAGVKIVAFNCGGVPLVSSDTGTEVIFTSLYAHGLTQGDLVAFNGFASSPVNDDGRSLDKDWFWYVSEVPSPTTFKVFVRLSSAVPASSGFVYKIDTGIPGDGFRPFGTIGYPQNNREGQIINVMRKDVHYVMAILASGSGGLTTFDSCALIARSQKSNLRGSTLGKPGYRAAGLIPVHNPQRVHVWADT